MTNKIDLAPYVGASLEVMQRDTQRMCGDKPFVFSNLKQGEGLEAIMVFIRREGLLPQREISDIDQGAA